MSKSGALLTIRRVADDRIEAQLNDGVLFTLPTEIFSATPHVGDLIRLSAVLETAETDDRDLYKQRLNELIAIPAI